MESHFLSRDFQAEFHFQEDDRGTVTEISNF
jgi:hypothetical protein